MSLVILRRHPPCEDVSWKYTSHKRNDPDVASSSLWGCELKRICKWYHPLRIRHPPCEDVSWKVKDHASEITETVILLVRMWVEKLYGVARHYRTTVILLVRMWVEKHPEWTGGTSWSSSSLWGCELKTCCGSVGNAMSGHPPCEDVSWKLAHTMNLICPLCHPPCEDVSWKTDLISIM